METKYLEQLIAIENSKSMRDAAEKLYISQSALSHNMKRIEEEFDCELFDRSRNKLTLNNFGRIVLEHAKYIVSETDATRKEIENEKKKNARELNIGVFSYAFQSFVMPNVANVMSDYMIESKILNCAQLQDGLKTGKLDIIFTDNIEPDEDIVVERLFKENIMVSVSSSSEYASRQNLFLEDLPHLNLFLVTNAFGYTEWFEKVLKAAGIDEIAKNGAQFNEYLYEKDSTQKSHLTSSFIMRFVPTAARRVTIPLAEDIATRDVYIAYRAKNSKQMEPLLDHIKESQGLMFTGISFLPYFLFPSQRKNLQMDESLGYNLFQ